MSQYAYVARDMTGKKVTGVVDAGSPREATAQLSAKKTYSPSRSRRPMPRPPPTSRP